MSNSGAKRNLVPAGTNATIRNDALPAQIRLFDMKNALPLGTGAPAPGLAVKITATVPQCVRAVEVQLAPPERLY